MEQNNALARKFNAASLLRFALPNIAMMMLLSMYTIVDGMFISRFAGTTALSAINMSYPLNCLQMATGIMLGTGGSAIIARRQGEGRTDEARRNFTMLIAIALGIGLIFAVFGNLFLNPILRLLGTSELQCVRDCHARLSDLCGQLPAHGHEYFRVLAVYRALGWSRVCDHLIFAHACVSRGDAAAPAADFAGNRHLAGCSGSRGARRDGFGVFSRQGTEKVSVLRERVLLREQHSFVIYR